MNSSHTIYFISKCARYGVSINKGMLDRILRECIDAGRNETGGIVWGKYNDNLDNAVITGFSKAPSDSVIGQFSFRRGIMGLQQLLKNLWNKTEREYYLGEWHFHPFSSSEASSVDLQQMFSNANNRNLHCPEPILIIIGGDPQHEWNVNIVVCTQMGECYNLQQRFT